MDESKDHYFHQENIPSRTSQLCDNYNTITLFISSDMQRATSTREMKIVDGNFKVTFNQWCTQLLYTLTLDTMPPTNIYMYERTIEPISILEPLDLKERISKQIIKRFAYFNGQKYIHT